MRHLLEGVLYDPLFKQPEKTAVTFRRHRWFPCELTPEKRVQKSYADNVSLSIQFNSILLFTL